MGGQHAGSWVAGGWLMGLVALFVAMPLIPEDPGGSFGIGSVTNTLWLLFATGWLAAQMRLRKAPLPSGWPDRLMLMLIVCYAISGALAVATKTPRPAINMTWQWIAIAVSFLLARQIIVAARVARAIIAVMLGLAVGIAIAGLQEVWFELPANRAAYWEAEGDLEELYRLTGQWLPPGSAARTQFESRLASNEPQVTFALTNTLAGFLTPWFVAGTILVVAGRRASDSPNRARRHRWTWAVIPLLGVLMLCLLQTHSRSAFVGLGVGLVVAIAWRPVVDWSRRYLLGMIAVVGFAILALVAIQWLDEPAWQAARRSLLFREQYWQSTLRMIADYPLLGCGPGQFQDAYVGYKLPGASEEIHDPHNFLLEIAATAGLPAAALVLALLSAGCCGRSRQAGSVTAGDITTTEAQASTDRDDRPDLSPQPTWCVVGGVAGLALGATVGWITQYPLSASQLVLMLGAMVFTWAALHSWVSRGQLPVTLPVAAASALVVHLLAAGGISYPSNATTLWLLIALAPLARVAPARLRTDVPQRRTANVLPAAVVAAVALLALQWFTQYRPVLTAQGWLDVAREALFDGERKRAADALTAAAQADPWSAAVAEMDAQARHSEWLALPSERTRENFERADARMLQMAPGSHLVWSRSAEFWSQIYNQSSDTDALSRAIDRLAEAQRLYPTLALYHARMADLRLLSDERPLALAAAQRAAQYDDRMREAGHMDRLLQRELRNRVDAMAAGEAVPPRRELTPSENSR